MRKRHAPLAIAKDSALAQLAEILMVQSAIGPPLMGPQVLVRLLEALHMDGWRPPKMSQSEGGRISGERRGGVRTIRRIAVGVIMDSDAANEYRNKPYSTLTHEWVHEELQKLSALLGNVTPRTIAADLADWDKSRK